VDPDKPLLEAEVSALEDAKGRHRVKGGQVEARG
jgi:hypothetical protein